MWDTVVRDTLRSYQALEIVKKEGYAYQLTPSTYRSSEADGILYGGLMGGGLVAGFNVAAYLVRSFCADPQSSHQFDASPINEENECSPYVKGAAMALMAAGPILGFGIAKCFKYQSQKHYENERLETNERRRKVMDLFNKYQGADSFLPLEDNDLITLMDLTDSRVWTHLTAYMSPLQLHTLSQRGSEKVQGDLKEMALFTRLSAEQLERAKEFEERRASPEKEIWTNLEQAMAGKGDEKLYRQAIEKACAHFNVRESRLGIELLCDFIKVRITKKNLKVIALAKNLEIKALCNDYFQKNKDAILADSYFLDKKMS